MISPISVPYKLAKAVVKRNPVQLTAKETKFVEGFSDISMWKQRGIIGAFALFMQTGIDANNRHIDEDTKKYSVRKTFFKVITCAVTGMGARWATEKLLSNNDRFKKFIADGIKEYKFQNAIPEKAHGIASKTLAALAGILTVGLDTKILNWCLKKYAHQNAQKTEKAGV